MRVRIIEPKAKKQAIKQKVCAYARVSTDQDKQGESLENQMTYYENLISSNPYEKENINTLSGDGELMLGIPTVTGSARLLGLAFNVLLLAPVVCNQTRLKI